MYKYSYAFGMFLLTFLFNLFLQSDLYVHHLLFFQVENLHVSMCMSLIWLLE